MMWYAELEGQLHLGSFGSDEAQCGKMIEWEQRNYNYHYANPDAKVCVACLFEVLYELVSGVEDLKEDARVL